MNKTWWKASTIRAIKTAAQSALASIGATTLANEVDWVVVGSTVVLATIASYLTSISGLPEVPIEQKEQE